VTLQPSPIADALFWEHLRRRCKRLIERALHGVRALGKIAAVVLVISAGRAKGFTLFGLVQRNAGVTKGFERRFTSGTGDRLGIYKVLTTGACGHGVRATGLNSWLRCQWFLF